MAIRQRVLFISFLVAAVLAAVWITTAGTTDPKLQATSQPPRQSAAVGTVSTPPAVPAVLPIVEPASKFVRHAPINPKAAPVPRKPPARILRAWHHRMSAGSAHHRRPSTLSSNPSGHRAQPSRRRPHPSQPQQPAAHHPATRSNDPLASPCCTGFPGWMRNRQDKPARLIISKIGVNAPVEDIALTSVADEHTPRSWWDAAWWDRGPLPGAPGVAFMYGHLDSTTGTALFWYLHTLVPGDRITVEYFHHRPVTFAVAFSRYYWDSQVPLGYLGSKSKDHILVLMTCAGTWTGSSYDHRLMVFAHQVA
ncbi:MAG TPA: sortase [Chloroflexota bacterium]|nr:sortase [Chloroflexota bacterium]